MFALRKEAALLQEQRMLAAEADGTVFDPRMERLDAPDFMLSCVFDPFDGQILPQLLPASFHFLSQ